MFIAYNIPPDSLNPAMVDDVLADKIPYGEYYYYVACHEDDVVQGHGKQSDLASLNREENACIDGARVKDSGRIFVHEVLVGFHEGHLEYGQSIVDELHSVKYDNFSFFREHLNADARPIGDFIDKSSPSASKQYQMEKGEGWATIVTLQNNENMCAEFEFVEVANSRLIQIRTRCGSPGIIVGDLVNPWLDLIAKYKNMPMKIFTGAEWW